MRSLPAARRRGGWTLIEILVVIAVVAVLVGLTIPVASSAVASARATRCGANLRAFGQAFALFRQANQDNFPFADGAVDVRVGRLAPIDALATYLDAPFPIWDGTRMVVAEPYRCPADQFRAADSGFSYDYLPVVVLASVAASDDRHAALTVFSRRFAENPKEPLLIDFDSVHRGKFNRLHVDGSVTR